jgi:hypothetical protein
MSVLEKLPSLIDLPRRSRRRHRPDQAKPPSSSSSVAPITRAPSSAPESANNNSLKRRGDGAAGDLTIVRPAAAGPPRRPEQVEQVGRHRAAQPRACARVTTESMVNARFIAYRSRFYSGRSIWNLQGSRPPRLILINTMARLLQLPQPCDNLG